MSSGRITLTKKEAESPAGKRLIDLILTICHDGAVEIGEVEALHLYLRREHTSIAAFTYLRAITREIVADGSIDELEAYRLKQAFERVVPKEARGVVSTHLQRIGLPTEQYEEQNPAWTKHEATQRQLDYIIGLGGNVTPGMTKGQAARLIDQLLERRPPKPRQVMLLRFFNRLDLISGTREEVSAWIDDLYASDERYERAWERFKRETNHDPYEQEPSIVPIGAAEKYAASGPAKHSASSDRKAGCLPVLGLGVSGIIGLVYLLDRMV